MKGWACVKEALARLENSTALDRSAGVALAVFACLLLLLPLALQLSRPAGFTDYFGDQIDSSHPDRELWKSRSILTNLRFDYWQNRWNFRPTSNLIFNICYYLFRGDFWCFDLLKWASKILAAFLIYASLRNLGCARLPGLCGAAFFLFHMTCFEAHTLAADPVLGFFFLVCFYLLTLSKDHPLDLGPAGCGWVKFCLFLAAFVLMLGAKEPSVALALSLIVSLALFSTSGRTTVYRLLTLTAVLAVHCYLILRPAQDKLLAPSPAAGRPLHRFLDMIHYTVGFPLKSWHLLLLLAVVLYGLFRAARPVLRLVGQRFLVIRFREGALKVFVCLLSALLAVTLINSIPTGYPPSAAPRYAIPGAMILALLVGLALTQFVHFSRVCCTLFLMTYPLLTGQNILDHHIILHKMNREASEVLCFLINKQREGLDTYFLAPSAFPVHDMWAEDFQSVNNFFGQYGSVFYQTPLGTIRDFRLKAPEKAPYAVFTAYEYPELEASARKARAVTLYRFPHASYGALEKLPRWFARAAKVLGKTPYLMVDRLSAPRLKVLVFQESVQESYHEVQLVTTSFGALAR